MATAVLHIVREHPMGATVREQRNYAAGRWSMATGGMKDGGGSGGAGPSTNGTRAGGTNGGASTRSGGGGSGSGSFSSGTGSLAEISPVAAADDANGSAENASR